MSPDFYTICGMTLIFSYLLVALMTPVLVFLANRFKILDYPDERKIHKTPIPRLGGVALAISFFVTISLAPGIMAQIRGLALASLLIITVGLIDDVRKVSSLARFIVQLVAAAIVIRSGLVISFMPESTLGIVLEIIITFLWIIGITNSFNFLDGMNGLASGLAVIASLCFGIAAIDTNQHLVAVVSAVILGCALGFIPFNFPNAKIFLGDSGSTFLGFVLASIGLLGTWGKDNIAGVTVPALILGVPIFDMILTTIMRVWNGKVHNVIEWIDYVGKDHFHHRLVDLGLHTRGAVLFIHSVSLCLGAGAIVLIDSTWSDAVLLLMQAAILFTLIAVLMVVGQRQKSGW